MEQAEHKLKKIWGYESFRPGQDVAIKNVLEGKDTLVLFPTGGGKSLCYQLPATMLEGMTLVISPLVALMQDQVRQLNQRGIPATFINSTLYSREIEQRLVNARNGMYKLLFCAPERLKTPLWEAEMPNMNIKLAAIDEAHCISEWGHDFRPSYREIRSSLEPIANSITWLALTATATPEVRRDIIENLGFENPEIVSKGFERPNLKWWVTPTDQKKEKLLNIVSKASRKGSGLIYGGTRKNCEEIAVLIRRELDIKTEAYHAGIESEKRKIIQEKWLDGTLPLVAATSAFGMGIDKADCRYVIHFTMPYSLEAYYQQAGRAGRDGRESYPLLIYTGSDVVIAEKRLKDSYPEKSQLQRAYDSLCDMFDLAIGSEMERAQQVSVKDLKKRAKLSFKVAGSSIKILNHLGILQLSENIKPKIGIRFIVNENIVREKIREIDQNKKADFLEMLYRLFGPESFREMKYQETEYLETKFDVSANKILKGLRVLQNHDHLITFEAIGEMPLVRILEPRQKKLPFGKKELEKHRKNLLGKLDYMRQYVITDTCREVYIRNYFGEENPQPCGNCDNCLAAGKSILYSLSREDLQTLKNIISEGPQKMDQIVSHLQWTEDRAKRALSYLVREGRVETEGEKYIWKA